MSIFSTATNIAGAALKNKAAIGMAVTGGMAYDTYRTDRARNLNPALAAAHGIGSAILFNEFMWPIMAAQLMPMVPMVNQALQSKIGAQQRSVMPMGPDGLIGDSPQLQTTRQRALQAIQSSKANARTYIGQEAGLFAARYR